MARELDRIVVVDLEATCWADDPPAGEVSEVIEVGVCTLDVATGRIADSRGILVAPTRSSVSPFCTELTTLTPEQVADGVTFKDACRALERDYRTTRRTWAGWGDYDRRQVERQCRETGVRYPFGPTHLNVKNLFALALGLPHEVGMDEALVHLGLPLEGTHHRGVDDARNIARILGALLDRSHTQPAE